MTTVGWSHIQVPRVLNWDGLEQFTADVQSAIALPHASGMVLAGRDDVFCLGLEVGGSDISHSWRDAAEHFAALLEMILTAPMPTIAAVNGRAVGGGVGLAASCDCVIAVETAVFALPELLLGFFPAMVLPVLERRVTLQRVRLRALLGEGFSAAIAAGDGLVDEVVNPATLDVSVRRAARSLGRARRETVAAWRRYSVDASALAARLHQGAADTAARLQDPVIARRLRNFQEEGIAPWQD
ncbi:MAG: enoyl-CoA hydratase/isomerase family protein [Gammaproteobacteria bacterium]